jgi:hypothetical protein
MTFIGFGFSCPQLRGRIRHEVNPMIVQYDKNIRRTCGSACSTLSAPAQLVPVGSEAAETPFPSFGIKVLCEEGIKLKAPFGSGVG